ncbi:Kelch repeat-containing protein [Bacteroides sp.]
MNNKLLFFFIILFLSLHCNAQKVGKVLRADTHSPIVGVNIYLSGEKGIATTDTLGQFEIRQLLHLVKKDTIFFSYVGYEKSAITLGALQEQQYMLYLQEKAVAMDEVSVTARQLRNVLQYERLAPLPGSGIFSFASQLIDSCILVTGGDYTSAKMGALPTSLEQLGKMHNLIFEGYSKSAYRYDIERNQWSKLNLNFESRVGHVALSYGKRVYILGGKRLSQSKKLEYLDEKIEIYDLERNKVVTDNVNPHLAINFASFVYQNYLILMGGSVKMISDDRRLYTKKAHMLNLKTGYWYELNDMLIGKETRGVLYGNQIYLFGGFRDKPLDDIDMYDLHSGKWQRIGVLPLAVNRPGIVCVDDITYIFENGIIQTYDMKTHDSRAYQIDLQLTGSELFYKDNKLYILGGCKIEGYDVKEPSADLYSINLSEFIQTESY